MNRSSKQAALVLLGIFVAGALAAVIVLVTHNNSDGRSSAGFAGFTQPSTSFTATLTMTVSLGTYGECEGGGYGDIRSGAQVEIVNQKREVLAIGTLARATSSGCTFNATITEIPLGEKMYGAKVGNANRGIIWQTEAEARTVGWALTLGD